MAKNGPEGTDDKDNNNGKPITVDIMMQLTDLQERAAEYASVRQTLLAKTSQVQLQQQLLRLYDEEQTAIQSEINIFMARVRELETDLTKLTAIRDVVAGCTVDLEQELHQYQDDVYHPAKDRLDQLRKACKLTGTLPSIQSQLERLQSQ
eukprot:TRINITY_DN23468_c0_g1_i1.p1 TRINITY_DN23468_c0_g1~~TRINITY_DN23468_c0_g1_i1.p1  ORF type:complete len:150 (-),score=9.32 TRINITY_DN23468_c0_g1_i1:643-1092(-)